MSDDETSIPSPFHAGEQLVQERLGVRDKIEFVGRRIIRDHITEQHRKFYAGLPFVLVGSVDDRGRPWASFLSGPPGFVSSPDPRHLLVAARPLPGDPLNGNLKPGADVSILGIRFETRRRNRLTGEITAVDAGGFSVAVDQAFGHCPQYIQTRHATVEPAPAKRATNPPIFHGDRLDGPARRLIARSDTFFIATTTPRRMAGMLRNPTMGIDVSHRGGKPGFVRVEDDRTLVYPEFSGNNHFNTVGNITLNPRAGFLFLDFGRGDLVYMSGAADIIWDGAEVRAFLGAERLIRLSVESAIRVEGALSLLFAFGEFSPMLQDTGDWRHAAKYLNARDPDEGYARYEIVDIRRESETITSFYLCRADGAGLAPYQAGQHLPIRVAVPGQEAPITRSYTLSDAPGGEFYRLSIRREGRHGLASRFFHDEMKIGDTIEALVPRGTFVLDPANDRPLALISAGIGITPMIAMTNYLVDQWNRTGHARRTFFIHGARNSSVHAFGDHIRALSNRYDFLTRHILYSNSTEDDRRGQTHDGEGRVDIAVLKNILPFDDCDFYLCGPPAFMRTIHDGLIAAGVRDERINHQSFASCMAPGDGRDIR